MSQPENQNINNAKNDAMSTLRLALHQDLQDLILKTPNRQGSHDDGDELLSWYG